MSSPTTSSVVAQPPSAASAEGAPAIRARAVSKKYELHRYRSILLKDAFKLAFGGAAEKDIFWALRNLSFTIQRGETVGIVGSNGAGKSTLLSLIAQTAMPTTGSVEVSGRVSALLELGAGFHPDFTGRENIYINGSVMGLTRKQIDQRIDEIIAFSELDRFIDAPVRNYSSGMRARLGFSVATAVDPDILIVDEVLAVGDQDFQEKSLNRILEFQRRGCTIVFVSHSLEQVLKLCKRAILISHGQVIADGPSDKVLAEYKDRLAKHQLDSVPSPYDKERVPVWKRALAFLALAGLVGSVALAGFKYVLSRELPEQRPVLMQAVENASKSSATGQSD